METAIVSGASSGMGKELVLQLAKSADPPKEIWIIARSMAKLSAVKKAVDVPVRIVQADLTDMADIAKIRDLLASEKPKVSLLANIAGFARFGMPRQISESDLIAMINLDVRSVVAMTDITLPYMEQGSSILEWASVAAFQPLPGMNVYAASKAFVVSYSRALNNELRPRGISVTAVCPGWTKTPFLTGAEKHGNGAVEHFMFPLDPVKVVRRALRDGLRHKSMSVYGLPYKLQWFFSKILPAPWIMWLWNRVRN